MKLTRSQQDDLIFAVSLFGGYGLFFGIIIVAAALGSAIVK